MAHFYFDVCTNGVTVEDEDGVDLLSAATALLEAVRTAASPEADLTAFFASTYAAAADLAQWNRTELERR